MRQRGFTTIWSNKLFLQTLLLGSAFLLCYWSTFTGIVHVWLTNDDYSHGFLILPVALYLAWTKRTQLRETRIEPYWPALGLFLFITLVAVYGILGSSPSAVRLTLPLMLLTIVLFCYGKGLSRLLLLPILFLFFMIPVPANIHSRLTWLLKLLSSQLALVFLRAFGISVYAEGNIIDLGYTQLQVMDACSGLRYIYSLLALALIYGYFFQRSWWKRVILLLSTVPMALIMNSFRITITGLVAEKWSPKVAEGFFHGFSGLLIFLVAVGFLYILNFLLNLLGSKESANPDPRGQNPGRPNRPSPPAIINSQSRDNKVPVVLASALLLSVSLLSYSVGTMPPIRLTRGIEHFPLVIKEWQGRKNFIDPEIIRRSGAEEAFDATYINNRGEAINLYLGYRGSAFLESRGFFHSPDICLPAGGWRIKEKSLHLIEGIPYFKKFKVKRLVVEKLYMRKLVYYWFQTYKKVAYDVNINRFHLAWHAIRRDNTPDVFVRVITPIESETAIDRAEERMDGFVRQLEDILVAFLHDTRD